MKKLLIIALFLVASCSSNKNVVNKASVDLPDWINETKELSAVGIANPSKGGFGYQIQMAELNAKGNLAAKIKSEISRVTKNSLRSKASEEASKEIFAELEKERQ